MHTMENMLSFEIKKEMADRYFGFRTRIEEHLLHYNQHIQEAYLLLENEVGFDLIRLYILLGQESLIQEFLHLTGLRDQIFFDPYLLHSPTLRQALFKGLPVHGFTRRSRFHNLFFDIYNRLTTGVAAYKQCLQQCIEEGEALSKEIEQFHRTHDLGSMMGFLRGIGSGVAHTEGAMMGGLSPLRDHHFEEKMHIKAPPAAESLLPDFPLPLAAKSCKNRLQELIDTAYEAQGEPEMRDLALLGEPWVNAVKTSRPFFS